MPTATATQVYYRTRTGLSTQRREWLDGNYWTETSVVPVGEESTVQCNDSRYYYRDGLRTFTQEGTGLTETELVKKYFERSVPLPGFEGYDMCGYCGTSNGSHGQLRHGWDCWHCGGN